MIKLSAIGYVNNEFIWETFAPISEGGGVRPASNTDLGEAIDNSFDSFDRLVDLFSLKINSDMKSEFI